MTHELEDLRKTLRQVFALHVNAGRNGHTMVYKILDAEGETIGQKVTHSAKKTRTLTVGYSIGDRDFATLERFLIAYRDILRDQAWEASAPKEQKA